MEADEKPRPWDRRDDESSTAFVAFCAYRDLGPGRSVTDAYRQSRRKPDAKQADGTWNSWAKGHRWAERARAFDAHRDTIRLHEGDRAISEQAATWVRRAEEQAERTWKIAQALMARAEQLASLPVVEKTASHDGKAVTLRAIRTRELRDTAAVATAADALAWSAIDIAMSDFDPAGATTEQLRAILGIVEGGHRGRVGGKP